MYDLTNAHFLVLAAVLPFRINLGESAVARSQALSPSIKFFISSTIELQVYKNCGIPYVLIFGFLIFYNLPNFLCFFLAALLCLVALAIGQMFTLRSGMYILDIFDTYAGTLPLLMIAFFETIAVAWIYGIDR